MLDEMCATLGGRAAEELFTGHISSGAMNDLERVTKQAYGMIAYMGMSDALPNLCYYNQNEYAWQRPYSEATAKLIDEEVKRMIAEQYERAKQLLLEKQDGHHALADLLVEREVIYAEDVEKIFGKRPWVSRTEELLTQENPEESEEPESPESPETSENPETLEILQDAFRSRTLEKYYVCLVRGMMKPPSAVCRAWLVKDSRLAKVRITDHPEPDARPPDS